MMILHKIFMTIDVKEVGHVEKKSKYLENIENEKVADSSDGPR